MDLQRDNTHDAFDRRAERYTPTRIRDFNLANELYPAARETERQILIDLLELRPGLEICDIAAGGGYLSDGIFRRTCGTCSIICVENSVDFAQSLPGRYVTKVCSLSHLDLPDSCMDRVACLAGIHHQQDKQRFFNEAFRILRPGGLIGIADVLVGSPAARFLNEAVDRWSDLGHDGMFLASGELTSLMANAGFIDPVERLHQFTWSFPDYSSLVWFCKTLFRMVKAEVPDVEKELQRYLRIDVEQGFSQLHWSLIYAIASKG